MKFDSIYEFNIICIILVSESDEMIKYCSPTYEVSAPNVTKYKLNNMYKIN
jgi:hypothetical protein